MSLNNSSRSLLRLVSVCLLTSIALIFVGVFSYLLKGWLIWDFGKPFPFGSAEIVTVLKISLLGVPAGLVFWFFNIS